MNKILVVHGPNLNLLGQREPAIYGQKTLPELNAALRLVAQQEGFELVAMQSNSEEKIIEAIHQSLEIGVAYIIINPAAFTHTSIAVRDALLSVNIPFVEVHISNTHARESFRKESYFSDIALGVISGFGTDSYSLALQAISTISKRESI